MHKKAVETLCLLDKEHQGSILAFLEHLTEKGREPKERASALAQELKFTSKKSYTFWVYEIEDFRLEAGIIAIPKPTVLILRIGFRTCKLEASERVIVGNQKIYADSQAITPKVVRTGLPDIV